MAKSSYPKTFTTHADQIALLEKRGMRILDRQQAEKSLSRIGYYRLSAYWYPFRERDTVNNAPIVKDNFFGQPSFEDVVDFYVFDKNLRLLVSDALERIEIALRAQIAYVLGARSPWAHRESNRLDGNFITQKSRRDSSLTKHSDWLLSQDKNFNRSKEDFAKHFRDNYSGDPPIWVATEVWDWGSLSHFYSGMKAADRNTVAAMYGKILSPEMSKWVHSMNDIRNICAHHSRLWNRGLKVTITLPRVGDLPELDHIQANTHSLSRIYGALGVMAIMMKAIHPQTKWHCRIREFVTGNAPKNPIISCQAAGFPEGWANESVWN